MGLNKKLYFGFSIMLIIMIILSILSWNAMHRMGNQNKILSAANGGMTHILQTQIYELEAMATLEPSKIDKALATLHAAIETLQSTQSLYKNAATVTEMNTKLNGLSLNLEQIKINITQSKTELQKLATNKQATYTLLIKLLQKSNFHFIATQNPLYPRIVFGLANITLKFDHLHQNVLNYQISQSPETIKEITNTTQLLKTLLNNTFAVLSEPQEIAEMKIAINNVEQYEKDLKIFIQSTTSMHTYRSHISTQIVQLIDMSMHMALLAQDNFIHSNKQGLQQLLIATIVAMIVGIFFAWAINRNVYRQLGADPAELKDVAKRVTHGDYDIDDGLPHEGVYEDLIEMVVTMENALHFSNSVLRDLPIACTVYDTDNTLQFCNQNMLNLLGHPGVPSDYLGQTSGKFIRGDDTHVTSAMQCIKDQKSSSRKGMLATFVGTQKCVSTIEQPIFNRNGVLSQVISIWFDITAETLQSKKVAETHYKMQNMAAELEQVASMTTTASEQLSQQIQQAGEGAREQAMRVESTVIALEEMNVTVLEVAKNASVTSESALNVRQNASIGSESMQACVTAIQEVRTESVKIKDEMNILSKHAKAIDEIMNVISDIADQTNLLALNAAIEAARAGDAGRGFAVVADEVRKLAEKTMASTTDVGNAITAIQKSTADNTKLVEAAVEKIEQVTEMVNTSGQSLLGIVDLANITTDQISTIAIASEEQSATSEEITQSVTEVHNIAKNTADAMADASEVVVNLVDQTHILSRLIQKLKTT